MMVLWTIKNPKGQLEWFYIDHTKSRAIKKIVYNLSTVPRTWKQLNETGYECVRVKIIEEKP